MQPSLGLGTGWAKGSQGSRLATLGYLMKPLRGFLRDSSGEWR